MFVLPILPVGICKYKSFVSIMLEVSVRGPGIEHDNDYDYVAIVTSSNSSPS